MLCRIQRKIPSAPSEHISKPKILFLDGKKIVLHNDGTRVKRDVTIAKLNCIQYEPHLLLLKKASSLYARAGRVHNFMRNKIHAQIKDFINLEMVAAIVLQKTIEGKLGNHCSLEYVKNGAFINRITEEEASFVPIANPWIFLAIAYHWIHHPIGSIEKTISQSIYYMLGKRRRKFSCGREFEKFHCGWESLYRTCSGSPIPYSSMYGIKGYNMKLVNSPPVPIKYARNYKFDSPLNTLMHYYGRQRGFDASISLMDQNSMRRREFYLEMKYITDGYYINPLVIEKKYILLKHLIADHGKRFDKSQHLFCFIAWSNFSKPCLAIAKNYGIVLVGKEFLSKLYGPSLSIRPSK